MNKQSKKSGSGFLKQIWLSVGAPLIVLFVGAAVAFYGLISRELGSLTTSIESLSNDVNGLNGPEGLYAQFAALSTTVQADSAAIEDISNKVDDLTDSVRSIDNQLLNVESRVKNVESRVLPAIHIDEGELNPGSFAAVVPNTVSMVTASYASDTYVGRDSAGRDYTVKDITGRPVLLTYSDSGLEVYFYGQLNKENHWDGFCVTNAYQKDGSLYSISECNYDDGKRTSFKSFYQTNDNNTEWIYTDRVCKEDGNFGISQKYSIKNAFKREFQPDAIQADDMLYINDALAKINEKVLLSYYHGWTTDGSYNDTSGTAYYLRYDGEGRIKRFYVGGFKNGIFHDQSGNAIELVHDGNRYFYYKGTFTNNVRDEDEIRYVDQEEIQKIIQDTKINFEIELNWITD